jgi:hypothetical protein
LRLFANQFDEKDLTQIKDLIGKYFANKLSSIADDAWQRNKWTDQDMVLKYFKFKHSLLCVAFKRSTNPF